MKFVVSDRVNEFGDIVKRIRHVQGRLFLDRTSIRVYIEQDR